MPQRVWYSVSCLLFWRTTDRERGGFDMRFVYVAISALLLLPLTAESRDNFWVIGGGPHPGSSEAQIEYNVNWVISSLHTHWPDAKLHVLYANGEGPEKSVKAWNPRGSDSLENFQPFARVFGAQQENGYEYRTHDVPEVEGSTRPDVLVPTLRSEFSSLRPGDQAFIIYNGHGLRDAQDPAGNTLRLWGDTELSAREFEQLLQNVDAQVPVRFVFTQCYSGGFARIIHPNADDVLGLAPGERCGFFAESEDRESEGCSASIDIGDYRDYTTYFFAALTGADRLGHPIEGNPDLDGNGQVSPYEAHVYVLRNAYNGDLPRSTSEVFLERWEPWYVRWLTAGPLPENLYSQLAREVAQQNGLPLEDVAMMEALSERRLELEAKREQALEEQGGLKRDIKALQHSIKADLALYWPEVLEPYTRGFAVFVSNEINDAQRFILAHKDYPALVSKQARFDEIEQRELLDLDRKITQLDKIERFRRLSRLLDQFQRHAAPSVKADFEKLISCEKRPL